MYVVKRNGEQVEFNRTKIQDAVSRAATGRMPVGVIERVAELVEIRCAELGVPAQVEMIQDFVEQELMRTGYYEVSKDYITYRYERALERKANTTDDQIMSLLARTNETMREENSNKNVVINSTQRDYMAGEVSKDLTRRVFLTEDIVKAHDEGIIHFHDTDYYAQSMYNCCLINLDDMLQNGTVISGTKIEKPHSFTTACTITTQIIAQVASNQYGGQTISLSALAPFVDISRQAIKKAVTKELEGITFPDKEAKINEITESRLKREVEKGCQVIQYQILTLLTTNGQTPFVSINMYLGEVDDPQTKADLAMIIEEILVQRMQGVKNETGHWITPAFPKLLYVLEEDNIHEDSPYWYLTVLAAQCTAKRMVPDYISEKIMKKLKIDQNGTGQCYPCMGCRSFLTPYVDKNGKAKYYGRFNQGVVTINLVDVACASLGDEKTFWQLLENRLELCHKALKMRHEKLEGTPSDVAPILWQYGAIARLEKGQKIDELLHGGYSTISLGYAGVAEMTWRMKGCSHTTPEGKEFALRVMQKLNDKCAEWKALENIDYSLYGTPMESTTYKFATKLKERWGIIPHVTDKNYITNSYHVHVTEEINAFEKLTLESEFQRLSPGGAISYVEVPNMQNNIPAVLAVIKHIYDTIMYAELNTKSDYCQCCGYTGEIEIQTDENGKLIWVCPNCGNKDQSKMNVARRTCGYIGSQFWNQGRTQEIKERVLHL
jgi:ribonucleoside-triphosphate reductase